jgi:hypothetical protein
MMDRVNLTNRLIIAIVCALQAFSLVACKAKCLPGYKMEGGSCKKLAAEGAAGIESAATVAGAGGEGATSIATSTANGQQQAATAGGASGGLSQSNASGQQSASGGASAPGSSPSASAAEPSESCNAEGSTRCASSGSQGSRETCMGNVWMQGTPCAAMETCVMQNGAAECAAVEKLCVGSNGQPVCDGQGIMLLCNEDGTIRSHEMCTSAKLCQAGVAAGVCATCAANEEYRCSDKALELCTADGMSFVMQEECETAALCNATVGMCTAAVCVPDAL